MKIQDIEEALPKVVRDVFEGMYFMFPQTVRQDNPGPPAPESCFKARICLKHTPIALDMFGSENLVATMASTLLGSDGALEETDLADTFKEAANVIAGNLVTMLKPDRQTGLDVPKAERLQTSSDLEKTSGILFDIDGEYFKIAASSTES